MSAVSTAEGPDAVRTARLAHWRSRLDTRFPEVDPVFTSCMEAASQALTPPGMDAYLEEARRLGRLGLGVEPMLVFLQEWPAWAGRWGEHSLSLLAACIQSQWKSPNGKSILPLLKGLQTAAAHLPDADALQQYLAIGLALMRKTTGSIHGRQLTLPSPGLPLFWVHGPRVLALAGLEGLTRWVDQGVRLHAHHPDRQRDYFGLGSPDSRAVVQRERRGDLLADHLRRLDLYLQAFWCVQTPLVGYDTTEMGAGGVVGGLPPVQQPYMDEQGMRVPDVYQDRAGVRGIDRYRVALAHMAAHRLWSRAQVADNWSPHQRLAVETFEDARVDCLLMVKYPGLRQMVLKLHPHPDEHGCDERTGSCLRHRLSMLSRALLDPDHGYANPVLLQHVDRFHRMLSQSGDGHSSTHDMAVLALSFVARAHRPSDPQAHVHFGDSVVDYRDDNRHLWIYIEDGDEEESFDPVSHRRVEPPEVGLPPRLYNEWDTHQQTYLPDWVSLYERLQPSGHAPDIDCILSRHAALARQLQRMLDQLKPQDRTRLRFQQEGDDLDLDMAVRSQIEGRVGGTPDPRVHMSHRTDGRDIAVLLLLDLSHSLNDPVHGGERGPATTVLDLSREAVTLLAWAVDQLGDEFAMAGFHSNTRQDVRYLHIKGFSEPFGEEVKGRLAGLSARGSTRMGVALRHAGHHLAARRADKKLLLILTDGRPSDIDVADDRWLVDDARQAVLELDQQGVYTQCISLDADADAYVRDIFGLRHTVIDQVARLPERLPHLFLSLTR